MKTFYNTAKTIKEVEKERLFKVTPNSPLIMQIKEKQETKVIAITRYWYAKPIFRKNIKIFNPNKVIYISIPNKEYQELKLEKQEKEYDLKIINQALKELNKAS